MEGRSARNCRRNGVNPAISAKGKTPDKKLNNTYLKNGKNFVLRGEHTSYQERGQWRP